MASNTFDREWSVKVDGLPMSIKIDELVQAFKLPHWHIRIPKDQDKVSYHAYINNFNTEEAAQQFAAKWSNSDRFGTVIRCRRVPPRNNELDLHDAVSGVNISDTSTPPNKRRFDNKLHIGQPDEQQSVNKRPESKHPVSAIPKAPSDSEPETASAWLSFLPKVWPFARPSLPNNLTKTGKEEDTECPHGVKCLNVKCISNHPTGWNPCPDGVKCLNFKCTFNHPTGWNPCPDGVKCLNFRCTFNHPTGWNPCRNGVKCLNFRCTFNHPTGWNPCRNGVKCFNFKCTFNHPTGWNPCRDGRDCKHSDCEWLHPPGRPKECDQPDSCSNFKCTRLHSSTRSLCEIGDDCKDESCTKIHSIMRKKKFLKSLEQRLKDREKAQLPIFSHRTEFCERLEREHVLIVTATNDSGKSTQLPQYVAEHFGSLVVCTQGSPVMAISLANNVAQEYDGRSVGESVGYHIGHADQVVGSDIMFMTNGTLISESQCDPALKHIRVLIIDEVEKPDPNIYDVLCIAQRLLAERPRDFYVVILSSTTINPTGFLRFFQRSTNALLKVEGYIDPVNAEEVSLKFFELLHTRLKQVVEPSAMNQIIKELEFNIVIIGSPRVGKSQLINALCGGKDLAKTSPSLNSCTKETQKYVLKTDKQQALDLPLCTVNFYDTPGIESWVDNAGKQKMLEFIEETDPICVIYCAAPGTFADLSQLRPILNKCKEKCIVCALVCTNMWSGNRREIVIKEFEQELQIFGSRQEKDSKQPSQSEPHKITYFGNGALCTMVNSTEYRDDEWSPIPKPVQGIDELVLGIMELLDERKMEGWCAAVLNRRSFWEKINSNTSDFFRSRLANVGKMKPETIVSVGMLFAKVAFKFALK